MRKGEIVFDLLVYLLRYFIPSLMCKAVGLSCKKLTIHYEWENVSHKQVAFGLAYLRSGMPDLNFGLSKV